MSSQGFYRGIITGRNFVETLILTLTNIEINSQTLSTKEYVTKRLEEELCSIASGLPFITKMYKDTLLKKIDEELPDIAKPELMGCFIYDQVLKWAFDNKRYIVGKKIEFMQKKDMETIIREITNRLVRSSIMGVFYMTGVIGVRI